MVVSTAIYPHTAQARDIESPNEPQSREQQSHRQESAIQNAQSDSLRTMIQGRIQGEKNAETAQPSTPSAPPSPSISSPDAAQDNPLAPFTQKLRRFFNTEENTDRNSSADSKEDSDSSPRADGQIPNNASPNGSPDNNDSSDNNDNTTNTPNESQGTIRRVGPGCVLNEDQIENLMKQYDMM